MDEDSTGFGTTLLRQAAVPLALLLVGAAGDLAVNTVLGRILGPEDYGDYAVAVSAAMICAGLAKLGADETVPRFLPGYLQSGRFGLAAGFVRGHLAATLIVAVLTAAVLAIFHGYVMRVGFDHPIALIWLVVPLISLNQYLFEVLVTVGAQVRAMAMEAIAFPSALIAAVLAIIALRGGATDHASVAAFGIAILVLTPAYHGLARRHLPERLRRAAPAYDVSRWVRFGVAVALSGFAFAAYTQLSLQIVELLDEDESSVGQFAAASKIADIVLLAGYAVHFAVLPRIALVLDGQDPGAAQRFIGRVTTAILIGAVLLAGLVIALHAPLTRLFGERFEGAVGPLLVMTLGNVALAPLSFAWTYLSLSGHEREPPVPIVIGFFALAISSYLAVPVWHIVAAAVCKIGVGLCVYGWMAYRVYRLVGVRLWRMRRSTQADRGRTGRGAPALLGATARMATADALESAGFRVHAAVDAETALTMLRERPKIALIVTDVGLPGMNGYDLVYEARRLKPQVKAVFVTGFDRTGTIGRLAADAATDFIDKPYDPEDLVRSIQRLLQRPV